MGSFYLVNLILAIVAMSYDDCRKQEQEAAEDELAVSLTWFVVDPHRSLSTDPTQPMAWWQGGGQLPHTSPWILTFEKFSFL